MPSAPRARTQLARSGMYFALARHPGFDWQQDLHGWNSHLARWRRDWRPADLQDPLFDLAGEWIAREDPNPFDDQLVAFLNRDRTPREDAPNDQAAVVYPWLRDLMRHEGEVDPSEEFDLHRKISLVTWELLDNIREHAHLSRTGQSSLATFATKGQPNYLNVYVMDTGVGIPASLRSRLGDDAGSDTDLVAAALNGELALRGPSGAVRHQVGPAADPEPTWSSVPDRLRSRRTDAVPTVATPRREARRQAFTACRGSGAEGAAGR